jgi:hypothetical protein
MELEDKELYYSPTTQIVEVKTESIICGSGEGRNPWEEDD